jgi:hypothetical protein
MKPGTTTRGYINSKRDILTAVGVVPLHKRPVSAWFGASSANVDMRPCLGVRGTR